MMAVVTKNNNISFQVDGKKYLHKLQLWRGTPNKWYAVWFKDGKSIISSNLILELGYIRIGMVLTDSSGYIKKYNKPKPLKGKK
jgi:hypothetical protein